MISIDFDTKIRTTQISYSRNSNIRFKSSFKQKMPILKKNISIWELVENQLSAYVNNNKRKKYSLCKDVNEIEKYLNNIGVNVRFNNDYNLANYILQGIYELQKANIEMPRNILFLPSIFSPIGIKAFCYKFNKGEVKESPIVFLNNIYNKTTPKQKSSTNPLHTFFHEVGHWLHFQNEFDLYKNCLTWNEYADTETIRQIVSERAVALNDGSEFCAEVFAGQMGGIKYPNYITSLAKKLSGYVIA